MSASAFFKYSVPALLAGAIGGYFVGDVLAHRTGKQVRKTSSLREDFLSTTDDEIDYEKLARVCLAAAGRRESSGPGHASTRSRSAILAEPDSPRVIAAKEHLDEIVSKSLELGQWKRSAGMVTRGLLERLPPSDVADFEKLLRSLVERGDLEVQPGAWTPEDLN